MLQAGVGSLLEQPLATWPLAWGCPSLLGVLAGVARGSWSSDSHPCPEAGDFLGSGSRAGGACPRGRPLPTRGRGPSTVRPLPALGKLASSKRLAPFGSRHRPALSGHPHPRAGGQGSWLGEAQGLPGVEGLLGPAPEPRSQPVSCSRGERPPGSAGDTRVPPPPARSCGVLRQRGDLRWANLQGRSQRRAPSQVVPHWGVPGRGSRLGLLCWPEGVSGLGGGGDHPLPATE